MKIYYTETSSYGRIRRRVTDDTQREALTGLTERITLTDADMKNLRKLGFELIKQ